MKEIQILKKLSEDYKHLHAKHLERSRRFFASMKLYGYLRATLRKKGDQVQRQHI
jgi:hypothetical protein